MFFLQNDTGAAKWPSNDSACRELLASFEGGGAGQASTGGAGKKAGGGAGGGGGGAGGGGSRGSVEDGEDGEDGEDAEDGEAEPAAKRVKRGGDNKGSSEQQRSTMLKARMLQQQAATSGLIAGFSRLARFRAAMVDVLAARRAARGNHS